MGAISDLSDRYVDEMARLDPVRTARSMGVGLDGDTLTDYSPDGLAALAEHLRRTLASLAAATPDGEPERLGAGYLEDTCSGALALIEAGEQHRLLNQLAGPPAAVRMLFELMDPAQAGPRLASVPAAIAGYRDALAAGLAAGRAGSRRLALAVADQCATFAGWFADYAAAVDPAAGRAADTAYADLASWLRESYAPAAPDVDGVGEERYRVWARAMLGADLDPAESYEWGCAEVARLEAEKAVECDRILPGAGFDEVHELLVTDPARSVHGLDAYRSWLQEITDEATAALAGTHFDIPEVLRRCEVAIPAEGSAAAPYYTPPSEDLRQPGRVWFPALGRTSFPRWNEVTTAYHEAVPGHHLQLGGMRVLPLTRAHRLGFQVAHGEGWALYAERLMDELGWFRTPDTRLGFLCAQAFRAVRVVVDIGLHTGRVVPAGMAGAGERWTYELAVDALARVGGLDGAFAESEVLRYLSWPAQATGYKLGERSWLAGRDAARAATGDAFDLRAWHAGALALGPLGLDRLESELAALD